MKDECYLEEQIDKTNPCLFFRDIHKNEYDEIHKEFPQYPSYFRMSRNYLGYDLSIFNVKQENAKFVYDKIREMMRKYEQKLKNEELASHEIHCKKCNRMIGFVDGKYSISCPKCKEPNSNI